MKKLFDDIDKIIISELQKDGRATLSQIGEKIGISHVAVRKRLEKLLKENLINVSANLNMESTDAKTAIITVEVENYERLQKLEELFADCPRVILTLTLSASNLMMVIFGENITTLESIIGVCSVRVQKGIRRSDVQIGNLPLYPKFLPLRICGERNKDNAPCGANCANCKKFMDKKCLGCPPTRCYTGPL
jgi:Lrp/AsnC family transcriptional regulator for asnA, asnC and gidA